MLRRAFVIVAVVSLNMAGCGFERTVPKDAGSSVDDGGAMGPDGGVTDDAGSADGGTTPDAGSLPPGTTPITVGDWNLNWFGSTQYGPSNDDLQQQNVTTVLMQHPAPLWALEEVVDTSRFAQVASALGYGYLTAANPSVSGSSDYRGPQQTAILYDPAVVTVQSVKVILGSDYYDFAERPPLEVALDIHTASGTDSLTVIVLHMKAYDDQASYDRRNAAARELKQYLDPTHRTDQVIVVGDFNDDLDTSLHAGSPSPYAAFVSDTVHYAFPTMVFTQRNLSTDIGNNNPIDHQMVTNELAPYVVPGSAMVIHPTITSYRSTTSDHYPIQVTYKLP